jgi:DNA polymerase-3 subunit delta
MQQKLTALVAQFTEKHGDSIERFDMQETADVDAVIDAVRSVSFLEPQKMVIVRNFSASKELLEKIEQLISSVADSTQLILVDRSLDKRSSAYKIVRSATECIELFEPNEAELLKWAQEVAKQHGLQMDYQLARYLVDRVGLHQQQLAQEISKLAHAPQPITKVTINELIEETPQSKVFALLDALFRGDLKRTITLYKEQRQQGEEPHKILGMIVWQLEKLTLAVFAPNKTVDTLVSAGMTPFNARKTIELSSTISKAQLANYVDELARTDSVSKKSADIESALMVYFAVVAKG